MIDKLKAFLERGFMRICFLGLALLSGRVGWFFWKIFIGIIDKYDVSTSDGHIDFFKAGVHLFPLMGGCFMVMVFLFFTIVCIGAACSKDEHKDTQTGDKEIKEESDNSQSGE